jgi:hypothetical protein
VYQANSACQVALKQMRAQILPAPTRRARAQLMESAFHGEVNTLAGLHPSRHDQPAWRAVVHDFRVLERTKLSVIFDRNPVTAAVRRARDAATRAISPFDAPACSQTASAWANLSP